MINVKVLCFKGDGVMSAYVESGPLVTIITVCFNSEMTIRRTIESILHQTYAHIEYIIIDGDSKDGTLDIIQEYKESFGERLRVISEPDEGIYDAMNKGIKHASGVLIGILNSDDFYEMDAVEKIVNAWDKNGMQILYGMIRILRDDKEDAVSLLSHNFLDEKMIWHPATFVTKDVYDKIGLFDTGYKIVADYDFIFRAHKSQEVRFVPVYSIITNYSRGGASDTMEGYLEGLRCRRDKGILSDMTYRISCIYEPLRRWAQRKLWR